MMILTFYHNTGGLKQMQYLQSLVPSTCLDTLGLLLAGI